MEHHLCIHLVQKDFLTWRLKPKKVVQCKTTNHCSAQGWEKIQEKEKGNYLWHKGRCLICLLVNSLNIHTIAGTQYSLYTINVH